MPRSDTRRVTESDFIVLANGASASPPASGLVEYLIARGARQLTTVYHPLTAEHGNRHEITVYRRGRDPEARVIRAPARIPYTYPLDALIPFIPPRVDGWFAFSNLLCARGLLERLAGRAARVVYWAVDFVPERFGLGSPLTKAYDRVDAHCCRHADLRVELSQAALNGRDARHGFVEHSGAPRMIAPIGAWLDRVPVTAEGASAARRVVFIGHMVERMGCDTVIEAMSLLRARGAGVSIDIAGAGPLDEHLRSEVVHRGLQDVVRFHGFISDHRRLEHLLSEAAVALAPYSTSIDSFTRYADPSKLKAYLAAGLPILLTDVPPNASELVRHAGAQVLADDPRAFADAIECTLSDHEAWQRRRTAALAYAKRFDWNLIVDDVLSTAGFEVR